MKIEKLKIYSPALYTTTSAVEKVQKPEEVNNNSKDHLIEVTQNTDSNSSQSFKKILKQSMEK